MEGDAGLPTITQQSKAEAVANTDAYGKSTIDAIAQGADYFAQFTCLEYRTGVIACWWPFGALGVMGLIGRLYYTLSAPLVMTAIAGTPAAASPATLTATRSILAPGFSSSLLFGPTLRKVPIRLQLFPYLTAAGGTTTPGWFTTT